MLRIWQILLQNWACYNQFSEGSFLCPILIENCTPLKKILRCLNIGFILTFLKKLMMRNWQRLLQNWAFYNQFSEGSFLCPIPIENCTPLNKILSCLNIASLKKKWIFKQSAAPTLAMLAGAFGRWRRVGLLGWLGLQRILSTASGCES